MLLVVLTYMLAVYWQSMMIYFFKSTWLCTFWLVCNVDCNALNVLYISYTVDTYLLRLFNIRSSYTISSHVNVKGSIYFLLSN